MNVYKRNQEQGINSYHRSTYPLISISSSSQTLSWTTSSAWPRNDASKVSSPSRLAIVEIIWAAMSTDPSVLKLQIQHHNNRITVYYSGPSTRISNSPPVAFAIRLRSIFLHRRTAIVPLSTKYFRQRSSMPPVVRITLAPADRIFWIRSLVMSASLQSHHIQTIQFYILHPQNIIEKDFLNI